MQTEFIWALIKGSVVLVSSLCVLLGLAWIAAKNCFLKVDKSPEKTSSVTQLPEKSKSIAA
jgi:archaellum component FlaF (FlaF/FlaG flagellin family)